MKKTALNLLLVLLTYTTIYAQSSSYITITGNISDKDTGEPMLYTHIGIPEKGIGTYSGYDGNFVLKIPEEYSKSTLIASFIGYKNYTKPIEQIDGNLRIKMQSIASEMPAVLVLEESRIEDLIKRAVKNIPKNYSSKPSSLKGFYRESKTDADQKYLYLAEGVLDVYKTDYSNEREGQTGLVQGRQVILDPNKDVEDVAYISSGHLSPHRFDFVKNKVEFIREENFDDYKYWIEGITTYNDMPVYIIGFDKAEEGKGRMQGKVFIDTTSYAFIRAEFKIRPEGLKKYNDYPWYVGSWKGNRYVVNYRKTGDTWHFSSGLREGIRPDGGLFSNDILITEIDPDKAHKIPYRKRLEQGEPFLEMTGEFDEDFWKQYNTTPMSSGLASSVQQLKTREVAEVVFDSTFMANLQRQRDSIRLAAIEKAKAENDEALLTELKEKYSRKGKSKGGFRIYNHFGAGVHLLETTPTNGLRIQYVDGSGNSLVDATGDVPYREQEFVFHYDLDILIKRRYIFGYGFTKDFSNSIYNETSWKLGLEFNVSKARPIFLRPMVSYSRHKYARRVASTPNENGKFKVDDKRMRTKNLTTYYGSRAQSVKFSLELAIEHRPNMDFFVRGTYFLPFHYQEHIYVREKPYFFLWNRKSRVAIDDPLVIVQQNEGLEPGANDFSRRITDFQTFMITAGVNFK